MKRFLIPLLLLVSMMVFAMTLQAQESSQTIPRKEAPRAEDPNKYPDSVFDEKRQRQDSLPDDKSQYPDSVFDEKRMNPDVKLQYPDSVFDEKPRSP